MITALSRFKVRNGLEVRVRAAFLARPHRVDCATGFLGMETYTDGDDPSVFHLLTRWTDAASTAGESVADASALLAACLADSAVLHCLHASPEGHIRGVGPAFVRSLGLQGPELTGLPVWNLVTDSRCAAAST